jgi:tRNA pseudouridine32 synthase / 23S rRNA pseudouridine746 synthase
MRLQVCARTAAMAEPAASLALRSPSPARSPRVRALPPLPTKHGVGPSCVALPAGAWPTIAQCLVAHFAAVPAGEWLARIEAGEVVDEHGVPVTVDRAHRPHLRVYYYRSVPIEAPLPFEERVLYRDAHIVVADKPHFLPVTPAGEYLQETLLVRLKRRLGIDTLAPVHRIDRETAGLVLFTTRPAHGGAYQALFARREVHKEYLCVAPAHDAFAAPFTHASRLVEADHFMRMHEVPGEANAFTRIEQIERRGALALYRLQPLTGRRHQLRAHCAALGMPIEGDRIYPTLLPHRSDDHARPLQLLARSLAFTDPVTGAPREFTSGLQLQWPPPDCGEPGGI